MARPNNLPTMKPDPILARVLGTDTPMRSTEIMSRAWIYIRENDRQDAADRKRINADEPLRALFGGVDSISIFQLAGHVFKHVSKVG